MGTEKDAGQAAGEDNGASEAPKPRNRRVVSEEPTPTSDGEALDALGEAFKALREVENAGEAQRTADIVERALGNLSDDQRRMVLARPEVQQLIDRAVRAEVGHRPPGSELRDRHGRLIGKIPWTRQAMLDHYGEQVEWSPHRTQQIIVNGIELNVKAGERVTSPAIFRDVHEESYQADINSRRTAEDIMRKRFGDFGVVIDLD